MFIIIFSHSPELNRQLGEGSRLVNPSAAGSVDVEVPYAPITEPISLDATPGVYSIFFSHLKYFIP
jgi:hypothetical protein